MIKLMIKKLIVAVCLMSPIAWTQSAIAPPQLGFVEDGAHTLRPAFGVAGNFILGPAVAKNILSKAFSGALGLLKTDSSLAAFDSQGKLLASVDAAPGPAFFAFSSAGAMALAYIASSNALIEWSGSSFVPIPLHISDTVVSIAFPAPSTASLLIQRGETVWRLNFPLGTSGASSQNALIGLHPPVLALPSGDVVYRDTGGIVIRKTDATEVHVAASLPASFSLQQMNLDWVQLSDLNSSRRFAIRATAGREAFYQLPE
jgi:hypothetical protein